MTRHTECLGMTRRIDGVQEQTKLVGLGRMAGSAVGSEMVLPCLDVVLGLTTRAVEPLVEVLGGQQWPVFIPSRARGARGGTPGSL
jgi:hypothetical protein